MSEYSPTERRILDSFYRSQQTSVIKSYWHSQLRSSKIPMNTLAASPYKDPGGSAAGVGSSDSTSVLVSTPETPSTTRSGGLTDLSSRGLSSITSTRTTSFTRTSSSLRRRLKDVVGSGERCGIQNHRERFGELAKPLFQNYLLPQFEAHETCPTLTVVFDLDETLVSNRDMNLSAAILRPYCLHVLNALRHMKGLEVVLWTASTKETASPVVEQLSESGTVFDEVIYRSDLWFTEPLHTKDLRLLGRDMDRLLIIDNAANCCKLNPQNAILAEDFHGLRREDDATLVNVYYIIERVLKSCQEGITAKEAVRKLATEGYLCSSLMLELPEAWKKLPLREIAPLKVPPHGRFTRAHREPLDDSVMMYWTM
ncbi:FCP1 homology domain [Trypanosoma melophagium]|uniref:FCP1 homology domain n=1 Tax=Trypanosoma melophagium TaxID=715481 RepID=UPI00351A133F|nr:FCP1 homology domain [Trypanosoma melophagium]